MAIVRKDHIHVKIVARTASGEDVTILNSRTPCAGNDDNNPDRVSTRSIINIFDAQDCANTIAHIEEPQGVNRTLRLSETVTDLNNAFYRAGIDMPPTRAPYLTERITEWARHLV